MLSVEQCRTLVPVEISISDEEIESLRDSLYVTAGIAFEAYWSESNNGSKNPLGLLHDSNPVDIV